jgi:dTDP-4-dehydrorhamnose 3,5-epimerase
LEDLVDILMEFHELAIAGVFRLDARWIGDQRGGFARLFCQKEFAPYIGDAPLCQINYSINREKGTIRGLHYQNVPHAEVKIVRCVKGKIFDVVVDLRRDSATFLQSLGVVLSSENRDALLVPQGCAHGFQILADDSEILYFHTEYYTPSAEGGIRYDDPRLKIDWPLPAANVSDRDHAHPLITPDFSGIPL